MTEHETIIEKCKEKYPIGTKVDSLGGSQNEVVDRHEFYWDGSQLRIHMNCALYDKSTDRWAPIIKSADSLINNYSIY